MKPVLRKERIYRPSSTDRLANRRSRSFRSSCEIGVVRWHAMPSTAEFSAPCSTGVLTAWVELTAIPLKPRLRCFFARGEFSENFLFFKIYTEIRPHWLTWRGGWVGVISWRRCAIFIPSPREKNSLHPLPAGAMSHCYMTGRALEHQQMAVLATTSSRYWSFLPHPMANEIP